MQLTKHTDFAYRVLIYLAGMKQEKTTIKEIHETFDISKTHLMKIVNELVNQGWIESTRGRSGGICLAVPPEEINLKDVLVHMENTLDPINCDMPMCHLKGICRLKPLLIEAQNAYLNYLAGFSLGDLINDEVMLRLQL